MVVIAFVTVVDVAAAAADEAIDRPPPPTLLPLLQGWHSYDRHSMGEGGRQGGGRGAQIEVFRLLSLVNWASVERCHENKPNMSIVVFRFVDGVLVRSNMYVVFPFRHRFVSVCAGN